MPLPNMTTTPRLRPPAADQPEHPSSYPLQFGIYRDGDNNLDEAQSAVLDQACRTSEQDAHIAFNVEDTTQREDDIAPGNQLRTEEYNLVDGKEQNVKVLSPQDMAERSTLTKFVANTLDQAQLHKANETWLDLVDHGGGDAGAFQTNLSGGRVMTEDDIAGAIADGVRLHGENHPEDIGRNIDGVLMNACLMATCGLESALSHVGVHYLAASPETMIAPGAPSSVAEDIVNHQGDPLGMARALVHRTMNTEYGIGDQTFGPAAAFDVLDLAPDKISLMEQSVKQLNNVLIQAAHNPAMKAAIKSDGRETEGMTRSQDHGLPWHADRPAETLYRKLASDTRLSVDVRTAANTAKTAIADTVLAHGESRDFGPFGDESYRDAAGPTVHFPTNKPQIDPWAPSMSETKNAFAEAVGTNDLARALT